MLFSQRKGLKPVRSIIQTNDMDSELRNALWDVLQLAIWDENVDSGYYGNLEQSNLWWLFRMYWHKYFKEPIDKLPSKTKDAIATVRRYFFSCEWHEVYDFMEFSANHADKELAHNLIKISNLVLERELSGYRFIGKKIVEISSEEETKSIENALDNTSALKGANAHLRTALDLLSDRKNPDYRNSIKEAISAVESLSQTLTGDPKATLGTALKELEKKSAMHPALKSSLSALYGYTSDSGGIRHAMLDEPNLTFTDAKFMLVACTAFVNYLVGKAAESGIKLS
jgi:hypothetical protein